MANIKKSVVGVALVLLLGSCAKKTSEDSIAVNSPMSEFIRFEYAVYLLPGHANNAETVLKNVLNNKHPEFHLAEKLPEKPNALFISARTEGNVREKYAPPSVAALRHSGEGLSREQVDALQKSSTALILNFSHPKAQVWLALREANAIAEEVARETGGLVWDEETREVFSPDAWRKKRLSGWAMEVPDLSKHTVIHAYSEVEGARAITLGMSKFGLPDVVVQWLPWSSESQVGELINNFCQVLGEGGKVPRLGKYKLDFRTIKETTVRDAELKSLKANGTGIACITLKDGKWEEGDPKNRLIELGADAYPGGEIQQKQDGMLSSAFGWQDSYEFVHHDEELLAASRKAKDKLPELKKAFSEGLKPGEYIEVKVPFRADSGNDEWMWVEVTDWKGNEIKGLLDNEPMEATYLRAGEVVTVREADVFDYIRHYADKHVEGNTTSEIIKRMSNKVSSRETSNPAIPVPDCSNGR